MFDPTKLRRRCKQKISEIMRECGGVTATQHGDYAYRDVGSNILAVAHCDYVGGNGEHFARAVLTDEDLIFAPQLDDRLGVYTILDILPSLVKCDVLLTDGEESGMTTAARFKTQKQYNWVVEFDRRGTDAVVYQYDAIQRAVSDFFPHGWGSFSDISSLDLGVCCFNVGIGYHDEHTSRCYMVVQDWAVQIERFVRFYEKNKCTRFAHDSTKDRKHWRNKWSPPWQQSLPPERKDDKNMMVCKMCDSFVERRLAIHHEGKYHCPDCWEVLEDETWLDS